MQGNSVIYFAEVKSISRDRVEKHHSEKYTGRLPSICDLAFTFGGLVRCAYLFRNGAFRNRTVTIIVKPN